VFVRRRGLVFNSAAPQRSLPYRQFLASSSPRRAQLLRSIDLPFTVVPVDFEEPTPSMREQSTPAQYVERLAQGKAAACDLAKVTGNADASAPTASQQWTLDTGEIPLVLAADTVVWHAGRILNKPRDADEAVRMLRILRGQSHFVYTGLCLRQGDTYQMAHEVTGVRFAPVSEEWIAAYVATGEPLDKAGAYGAQERGAFLIERIDGDYFNVVGLPVALLGRMLAELGAPLEMWWNEAVRGARD
jgi:septum formation protein